MSAPPDHFFQDVNQVARSEILTEDVDPLSLWLLLHDLYQSLVLPAAFSGTQAGSTSGPYAPKGFASCLCLAFVWTLVKP